MGMKTYHHRFPGAKFYMGDGREISFAGGTFTTDIPDVQKELDKVANQPASMIYTVAPVQDMAETAVSRDILQTAEQQFDDANKIKPGAQTVAIPVAPSQKAVIPGTDAASRGKAPVSAQANQSNPTPPAPSTGMQEKIAAAKAAVADAAKKSS